MNTYLGLVTLVVRDYDEALDYFTGVLGFNCMEDTRISEQKRWVVVGRDAGLGCGIVLAKAKNKSEEAVIGNQTGGRVYMFLYTDDFWRDYETFTAKGVVFREKPRVEDYGTVAVFEDLYGNLWDLIQTVGVTR